MLYHYIVKKLVRQGFEHVNARNFDVSVKDLVPNIHHRLGGTHALSGERHTKEAVGRWFERLGHVFPNLHLKVNNIWVQGWPWNTTVFVQWDGMQTLQNGDSSFNHGLHIMKMRWGKVYAIDLFEDSQEIDRALLIQATAGIKEASVEAIIS